VVAAACLFLAGKANNDPCHLNVLVIEMLKQWYGGFERKNPDMRRKLADDHFRASLMDAVKDAEVCVMFTLGFDFNVDVLHFMVFQVLKDTPCLAPLRGHFKFQQFFINTCNDIMRKDATLVLQYSAHAIALTICEFYFKLARQQRLAVTPPEPAEGGAPWYTAQGLPPDQWRAISERFFSRLFVQQAAGADSGTATAGLTGMALGTPTEGNVAMSSAAGLASAPPSGGTATVLPVHSALESTADKPLHGADGGGGAPPSSGKRKRQGGGDHEGAPAGPKQPRAHPAPMPRSAAPRGAGASLGSAPGLGVAFGAPAGLPRWQPPAAAAAAQPHARHPPAQQPRALPQQQRQAQQPKQAQPPRQPLPSAPPAQPPKAAPPAAPPQADSDLEEGEIEEGEIV
jgi:hypothetical protein